MANLPISGLPAGGAISTTDPFATVQAGVTVQVPGSALATFIQTGAPLVIHPGYVSNRFYTNALRIATGSTALSAPLNQVEYTPLQIWQPVTIASFGIKTGGTNAAAGLANIGIYTDTAGAPDALLTTVATAVAIPATANTNITVTPGASITLAPGAYWFAIQTDTTINMAGQNSGQSIDAALFGTTNSAAWFAATSWFMAYTEAAAYAGGLPNPATPVVGAGAIPSGIFKVA